MHNEGEVLSNPIHSNEHALLAFFIWRKPLFFFKA